VATNQIKILYVVDNLSFGGGERGFRQLSSNLNKNRFQTYVAAHPGGELEKVTRQAGVTFFPLDMRRKVNFKTIGQLTGIVFKNRINIVHSMGSRANFFSRLACRGISSTAVICTVAMLVEGYDVGPLRKVVYMIADRFSSRYVTHYIAVSKALKQRLVDERSIPSSRISVIYNGVELDKYNLNVINSEKVRRSLGIDLNIPVIGTIGRLVYQKGFSYFLEAAEMLYRKKKQIQFVIVGHGPEENNLKKMAESLGISKVCIFAGQRFDIPELLSVFDIFVLSSVLEGLPRIVIEAMAMERPIVATDIDGVREELTHEKSGLLVSHANPKTLAEAVLILLDDRKKAKRLGYEARKRAEQIFDLKNTLTKIEAMYEEVLTSTSRK